MPTVSEINLFELLASGDKIDIERFKHDAMHMRPTVNTNQKDKRNFPNESNRQYSSNDQQSNYIKEHDTSHTRNATNNVPHHSSHVHKDFVNEQNLFDNMGKQANQNNYGSGSRQNESYDKSGDGAGGGGGGERNQSYEEYQNKYGTGSLHQKRSALYELRSLLALHPELVNEMSHKYTMDDSLPSIVFESERIKSILDINSNLGLLETGLGFVTMGIEFGASKLQLASLEGWSNSISSEQKRFRPILLKIYRRVFRKGISMNPFLELTIALVSSAFAFSQSRSHFSTGSASQNYSTSKGDKSNSYPAHKAKMNFDDFGDSDDESDAEMQPPTQTTRNNNNGIGASMGGSMGNLFGGTGAGGGGSLISSLLPMLMT
tara:strand:+ start:23902 stop:25029 length:1128 start_codon:yes stop_codon:yes gene_type:complete